MKLMFNILLTTYMFEICITAESPENTSEAYNRKMFDRVNDYREQKGLKRLEWNDNLAQAADIQTNYQVRIGEMTHANEGENAELLNRVKNGNYQDALTWGENVAWCTEGNDQEVMDKWILSPKHNENMIGDFEEGAITSALGKDNKRYWTMVFGKRSNPPKPNPEKTPKKQNSNYYFQEKK